MTTPLNDFPCFLCLQNVGPWQAVIITPAISKPSSDVQHRTLNESKQLGSVTMTPRRYSLDDLTEVIHFSHQGNNRFFLQESFIFFRKTYSLLQVRLYLKCEMVQIKDGPLIFNNWSPNSKPKVFYTHKRIFLSFFILFPFFIDVCFHSSYKWKVPGFSRAILTQFLFP